MNEGDHGNKTSSTRTSTLSKTIDFIKRSRLEPLIIGYDFSSALRNVATQQLIQDKICLRSYTESNDYCHLLSQANNSDTKEQIVTQVSQYLGYKELLIVIPSILSALFIGSWCDRFLNGKRYCMLSTTFSQFLENVFLLLNAYYFGAGKSVVESKCGILIFFENRRTLDDLLILYSGILWQWLWVLHSSLCLHSH